MRSHQRLFALCVFAVLLLRQHTYAQPGYAFTMPEKVYKADAVCVGSLVPSSIVKSPTAQAETTFEVNVDQVLKGVILTKTIVITANPEQYIPVTSAYAVFFLLGDGKSQYWDLCPYEPPLIDLGVAKPQELPAGLTPFRAVVLSMAQALSSANDAIRQPLLDNIADIGLMINPKTPKYVLLASQLSEDSSFEQFCVTNIVPLTSALDNNPDMLVRVSALGIQAMLQDQSVLPALRRIAESAGNAADAPGYVNRAAGVLASYNTMATAPYMLRALNSPIHRVWYGALQSLVDTLGSTVTPLLIDRIQAKDTGDQDSIIWWLYQVTGEHDPRVSGPFVGRRQAYVDYWHHWENAHKAEVSGFRAQLAALAKN